MRRRKVDEEEGEEEERKRRGEVGERERVSEGSDGRRRWSLKTGEGNEPS